MLPTPTTTAEFMINCLMATSALAGGAEQVLAVEGGAQGFGRQFREQRMHEGSSWSRCRLPKRLGSWNRSILPLSRTKSQCSWVFGAVPAAYQTQASRHAQMQDHGACVYAYQHVLGSPLDPANDLTAHGRFELGRHGPAQTPLAHDRPRARAAPARQARCRAWSFLLQGARACDARARPEAVT